NFPQNDSFPVPIRHIRLQSTPRQTELRLSIGTASETSHDLHYDVRHPASARAGNDMKSPAFVE
ncbi:MAG: hypothetical protein AAF570_07670, partial [Bacteroidota bacterium]